MLLCTATTIAATGVPLAHLKSLATTARVASTFSSKTWPSLCVLPKKRIRNNPSFFWATAWDLAAQQYLLEHSYSIDGGILSGSDVLDGMVRLSRSAPQKYNLLNAAFEPARTPFDWLSRETAIVDAFLKDPLSFPILKPASTASFLGAAPRLAEPAGLSEIRQDLPVYLFSGSEDPVGERLAGVRTLMDRYHRAGVCDTSFDFYEGARHEMLNETNRGEVRTNLLVWIAGVLRW